MRWRLTEDMAQAIRILAEMEDRSMQDQTRHLVRLGLEQERERLRRMKWPRNSVLAVKVFFKLFGESWEGE